MTNEPTRTREGWPAGVVTAFAFVIGLAVLLLIVRYDADRVPLAERIAGEDVLAFEASVAEDLGTVTVQPVHRLRVRAADVEWRDDLGEMWLQTPRASFTVQVAAVLGGPIVIEGGVIEAPRLRLVERAPGRWNYERPLAPLFDPDRPARVEAATSVQLRNILVRNGQVSVVLPAGEYRTTGVTAALASAVLAGPGVTEPRFHLSSATGNLTFPDTPLGPTTRAVGLQDARFRLPEGAVAFEIARLSFGASVAAELVGVWSPAVGGLGLDARAVVQRLELADIPWLRDEAPEDAVAAGAVRIQPLPGDRSAVSLSGFTVRSETSAASGSLHAIIGPAEAPVLESIDLSLDPLALTLVEAFTGPLPYVGEVRGTVRGTGRAIDFDLRARLATSPGADRFTVDLTGQAALLDVGVELRRLAAELHSVPFAALEPIAPGLPFRGVVSGTVRLEGAPGEVPMDLDVRLEAGGGVVTVAGTVDLRGATPSYDLQGRLIDVELQRILLAAAPPVRVHASFAAAGSGVALPEAVASVRVDGRFAGWHATPGDTIALQIEVVRGLITAEQARVLVGPVDLTAEGSWRFAHGVGGAIRYSLAVASLEPLAPYLPPGPDGSMVFARGALAAQGTLTGTLEAPALTGTLQATEFRYGEWAAARLEGEYDIRLGAGLPRAVADVTGRDVRTPGGDFTAAELAIDFREPTFDVRFRGDRPGALGAVEIEAEGRIDDATREVVMRTIELDLDRQRWRLPAPARIEWAAGDTVRIEDLRLEQVDGEGLIRVSGILSPGDLADLDVEVAALPVGEIIALLRPGLGIEGDLWLRGHVRGPAESPVADLEARLVDGAIRGVAVQALQARLEFRDQTLTVVGDGLFEEDARFDLEATLPMLFVLGLPPMAELIADAPIHARLYAEEFDLAVVGPGIPTVRELAGRLSANLLVAGTAVDPILSGGAVLRDGAVLVPLLNQRYTGIEGEASLDGDIVTLDRLVARSDGTATVHGTIRLVDLANPVLDLTTDLETFRAQGVSGRRDAAISGRLRIQGTPVEPLLSGNLLLDDGTLDIAQLQPTPPIGDELIGIAERFDPLAPADFDLLDREPTRLRISRLDLVAGSDIWFQTEELRAQMRGEITVRKPGDDVMIVGTLTGERGTFNLRIGPARRHFDIINANLQFFGSPGPDPGLDITAARIIPGPNRTDFELRIRVTGTLSAPAIAFATEDGTSIPESEALNFLIFGRATATLADFPGAGFGTPQGVYDALAFYGAFDWISAALAEQFGAGIDYFQVQVRTGAADLAPELYFVLGHEVVDDVFVLVTLPTVDFEARWAVAAEWRIDRQWTLETGYEPPDVVIGVPGRRLPIAVERDQQLFVSIRRRWTY